MNRSDRNAEPATISIDGIKTLPQLVLRLQPHFASASLFQAPSAASGATGGRTVALTTANTSPSAISTPGDSARIQLSSGTLTWTFATQFNAPPVVTFGVEGAPTGTNQVYMGTPSKTAVTVTSQNALDARFVNLIARGNPN